MNEASLPDFELEVTRFASAAIAQQFGEGSESLARMVRETATGAFLLEHP